MKKSCVERQGALYSCEPVGGGFIHSGQDIDIMAGKAPGWGQTERVMYGRANGRPWHISGTLQGSPQAL